MTICIGNRLLDLSRPQIMAIINMTPDSFVPSCRCVTEVQALATVANALQHGAAIIDIGACSTRPGSTPVDEAGEWARLKVALRAVRDAFPEAIISVDTFRADVAKQAIDAYGVQIINDVSGGSPEMYEVIANKNVPYILTFARKLAPDEDPVLEATDFFVKEVDTLHRLGVSDVIIDPGFGFGKSIDQNYQLLHNLDHLKLLHQPLLVGVSRKSMIYKPLGVSPEEALNGTTVLHTIALRKGADILRVHDVKEANQVIQLCSDFK